MLAAMKPFGAWGIGALAVVDSAAIPLPIDAALIYYVVHDHGKFVLYCFMAALGSAIGSLLPFYIGRAGGELFLLKRINRKRYEQLRDRFERQEFLALMIPAMMPPPMPVKLFEFAAGVFEMKHRVVLLRDSVAASLYGLWRGRSSPSCTDLRLCTRSPRLCVNTCDTCLGSPGR